MNLVLADKQSNKIRYFVVNAKKSGNKIVGANISLSGIKKVIWKQKWTEDVIDPIFNKSGDIIGWNANFDEVTNSGYDPVTAPGQFKNMTKRQVIEEIESVENIEELKAMLIETFKYLKHLIP